MKLIFKLGSLSILIFFAASILSAQQKSDDSKEFDVIYRKSFELRREKPNRIKTTSETFDNDGVTLKEKYVSVNEAIPPDRSYYSSTSEVNSVTKKSESIKIGEKRFVRRDGGEWKIDDSKGIYGVGAEGRKSVKLIEKTTFNNQTVNVYEVKGNDSSSLDGDSDFTAKYWFNEAGLLLKEESENIFADKIVRRVSIYEFDANIKIEAPNLSKEIKP